MTISFTKKKSVNNNLYYLIKLEPEDWEQLSGQAEGLHPGTITVLTSERGFRFFIHWKDRDEYKTQERDYFIVHYDTVVHTTNEPVTPTVWKFCRQMLVAFDVNIPQVPKNMGWMDINYAFPKPPSKKKQRQMEDELDKDLF